MTVVNWMTRNTADGAASPLRSFLVRLRFALTLRKQADLVEKPARDPWVSAIDAVANMDEHTLKDIGAPAWLMAEVRHRQSLASKRLLDLHIR